MFLYLQCFNHKKIIENNDVSKVLNFMFKALKINIWNVLFKIQKSFFLIKDAQNVFKFMVNFIRLHKKGHICGTIKMSFQMHLIEFLKKNND
jgi:hypothetical protein